MTGRTRTPKARHRTMLKERRAGLLENLNKEPDDAEVHYLAHTVEEWRYYFGPPASPAFRLSFTANHAHLVPKASRASSTRSISPGRRGTARRLLPQRVRGASEAGRGNLDFGDMFRRLENGGFTGHYTNAFGSLDDMLAGRDGLVRLAAAAGVAVD